MMLVLYLKGCEVGMVAVHISWSQRQLDGSDYFPSGQFWDIQQYQLHSLVLLSLDWKKKKINKKEKYAQTTIKERFYKH